MKKSINFVVIILFGFGLLLVAANTGSPAIPEYKSWLLNGQDLFTQVGNVGIGTVNPAAKLHVSGGGIVVDGTGATVDLTRADTTTGLNLNMNTGTDLRWRIGRNTGNEDLLIENSNLAGHLLLLPYDNVGIGTTNPSQKLHVNGTIYSESGGFKFPDGSVQTTALAAGGATFGGSHMRDANTGSCLQSNPLIGSCLCPSGFSEYIMFYGGSTIQGTGVAHLFGCYKLA